MDRGTWWVTVHGVAKNWTPLRWLSTAHTQSKGNGRDKCLVKEQEEKTSLYEAITSLTPKRKNTWQEKKNY